MNTTIARAAKQQVDQRAAAGRCGMTVFGMQKLLVHLQSLCDMQ
jgi:hypothetical protein